MQLVSITTTNASHRYPTRRDQNEYKFIVGTSEKQWRPHISHKKTSTCQLKALCVNFFVNRVAAEDKNNIVYKIDCGNREAVNPNCL